jgi:alpha-tubulin suppressor-like RCC1 family protein
MTRLHANLALVAVSFLAGCDVGVTVGTLPFPPERVVVSPRARPVAVVSTDITRLSEPSPETVQVFVDEVVAGAQHTCARSLTGAVRCWGDNSYGQLGHATERDFTTTPGLAATNLKARRVFAGPTQTAVLTEDGQIGHWGLYAPRNDDGVTPWSNHDTPGVGALVGVSFGERFAIAWDGGGRMIAWGAPDRVSFTTAFLIKPVIVHLGLGAFVADAAVWSRNGDGHGCIVLRTGAVACWGRNDRGQTSRGAHELGIFQLPALHEAVRVWVGERFSCALRRDRAAWCWGANDSGQLGDGIARDREVPALIALQGEVLALTLGVRHACALRRDGAVFCWGSNDRGQLGSGAIEVLSSVPVRVTAVPKATSIAAGDHFTCARTEDGHAWCWGDNDRGQLGDGTLVRRAMPRVIEL